MRTALKTAFIHKLSTISVKARFLAASAFLLAFCGCVEEKKDFIETLHEAADAEGEQRQLFVDNWLGGVENYPLIEDSLVYFLYRNKKDLPVYVTGDMSGWRPKGIPMLRIVDTDLYYAQAVFPAHARLEYKIVVAGEYQLDSLNARKARGGFGENSLLLMPHYEYPDEWLMRKDRSYTQLDTMTLAKSQKTPEREVYVYRHQRATPASPLVVFHDGSDYIRLANTAVILDNLISENAIPALNALFINPLDRMKEYRMNDDFLHLVFNGIVPEVKAKYGLAENAPLVMGGASLGGLISFYALKDYAGELQAVFSQSGSFWIDSLRILDELEDASFPETKLYYSFGSFENQDSVHNRLRIFLREKDASFKNDVFAEGHNWGQWGGHLDDALLYIFNDRTIYGIR